MQVVKPDEISGGKGGHGDSPEPLRNEIRHPVVRMVDYVPAAPGENLHRVGFTRDLSDSGMCLGLDEAASVGSLLRVTVRDLSGVPQDEAVARVVWSRPDTDSRIWHGLVLLPRTEQS